MKALKKVLAIAACAALVLTVVPVADVEAATVLATYGFDTTDGLTDPGFGTLPSIVDDTERGKVLQFADGESPSYVTESGNNKGVHKCEIVGGSPSSYQIANPYENSGLTSMTISFWVKATDSSATEMGAGILGFVSAEYTADHPDARSGQKTQDEVGWYETGCYVFGASIAQTNLMSVSEIPMLNFAGLYHNWYIYKNEEVDIADGTWHHIIITTDSSHANTKVYLDGADLGGYGDLGKRWNHGEKDASNSANTLEPTLMDVVCMAGTSLYIGQTGSNPTSSAVYLDDLTFYDSIVTDAEALALYNEAKASSVSNSGSGSGSNSDSNQSAGNDSNTNNVTGSSTVSGNKNSGSSNSGTSNLPQTGVISTTAAVGIGVSLMAAGAVLLKKKEK